MDEWKCNKLFLATEDKTIVKIFNNVFENLCITLPREYVNYNPERDPSVSLSRIDRANDHFQQGKDYLTQIMLLSMCNAFVGTRCSGTTVAAIWGEQFEHKYFFNLGKYGVIGLD